MVHRGGTDKGENVDLAGLNKGPGLLGNAKGLSRLVNANYVHLNSVLDQGSGQHFPGHLGLGRKHPGASGK
jgi:hypothetical protein